ncbi:MAG TPA: cobyrinate a,c-diamide synthase [Syntrophomonadaceae bacterium]|nr:cobyrinate a,c-diamide synthase [Syntrophomonadaceae bacterium]
MKNRPRLMIAAVRSGSGKTSIATGLMGALVRRGYRVQGFKVGPDFIDPSYHTAVTGRWSRNLDTWLLSYSRVREFFWKAVQDADLAVIEGVMGLFDGLRRVPDSAGAGERASSAEIAKLLGCPVVLVLDVHAQARSAVVEYLGCRALDRDLLLAGVILNRVQGPRHLEMLLDAFRAIDIPVLGAIQAGSLPRLTERHLGLVPVPEQRRPDDVLAGLSEAVGRQVDLDAVLRVAESAPSRFRSVLKDRFENGRMRLRLGGGGRKTFRQQASGRVRIAYAWDEAFNFYYRDGLALLEEMGLEPVPFSPLRDRALPPETRGVLIGGGFPELFAERLSANDGMKESLRSAHARGMPIYAECGGFMYLCESLRDLEGRDHPMVGLVPGSCRMERRLVGMGYVTATALSDNILCRAGQSLRGHEFHYSTFTPQCEGFSWAFSFLKGERDAGLNGYASGNLLASYLHYHFASSPRAAARFAAACRAYDIRKF